MGINPYAQVNKGRKGAYALTLWRQGRCINRHKYELVNVTGVKGEGYGLG
jgi:hypothetical protein